MKDRILMITALVIMFFVGLSMPDTPVPVTPEQLEAVEARLDAVEQVQVTPEQLDAVKSRLDAVEVSRGGERPRGVVMEATAYTWTGNRTSTGTWPVEGRTVAVDPDVIPYGSRLMINGQGGYVAEDSGSAVTAGIVDLYLDSEEACVLWGRRQVEVIVE